MKIKVKKGKIIKVGQNKKWEGGVSMKTRGKKRVLNVALCLVFVLLIGTVSFGKVLDDSYDDYKVKTTYQAVHSYQSTQSGAVMSLNTRPTTGTSGVNVWLSIIGGYFMYRIAICDEDDRFITDMKDYILRAGMKLDDTEFYEFSSGKDFVNQMKYLRSCELLILERQTEEIDGHAVARQFRKIYPDSLLVYCSSSENPTDETIKTLPYRYFLKSYSDEKMLSEIREVVEKMVQPRKIPYITGVNHKSIVKLLPEDILYIENCKRGSEIHICKRVKAYSFEDKIRTRLKLSELHERLKTYGFEYAHNSYIVNLNYVSKFSMKGVLKLTEGDELNVSRSKLPKFRRALVERMGEGEW